MNTLIATVESIAEDIKHLKPDIERAIDHFKTFHQKKIALLEKEPTESTMSELKKVVKKEERYLRLIMHKLKKFRGYLHIILTKEIPKVSKKNDECGEILTRYYQQSYDFCDKVLERLHAVDKRILQEKLHIAHTWSGGVFSAKQFNKTEYKKLVNSLTGEYEEETKRSLTKKIHQIKLTQEEIRRKVARRHGVMALSGAGGTILAGMALMSFGITSTIAAAWLWVTFFIEGDLIEAMNEHISH